MMRKALSRLRGLFLSDMPDSGREELTDTFNAVNVARAKLTALFFIVSEIILLAATLLTETHGALLQHRSYYLRMYSVMLICMIGFFLLFRLIQKDVSANRKKVRLIGAAFTSFILFWCAGISLMDQVCSGQIMVYIFALICVSVTPVFAPLDSLAVYLPPQITFAVLSLAYPPETGPPFGDILNTTMFAGISWAISYMRYRRHTAEFLSSKLIEQKNRELERMNAMLQKANRELEQLSRTDGLTGVFNRSMFDFMAGLEWESCRRQFRPLSLIMIDIDFFKSYNDHLGHPAGDDCIRKVAQAISSSARRASDTVARYGGEEFAVILPGTGREQANLVAEQIRGAVERMEIPHGFSGVSPYVTISLGVSSKVPGGASSVRGLIADADKALYEAKKRRNCVGASPPA